MFKKIAIAFVILAVIGAFLPESETSVVTPVVAEVVAEVVVEPTAEAKLEAYRQNRFDECYGAMTKAHKKNGLQKRNRKLAIQTRESICTAALTDATITGWNTIYTEVK